MSNLRLPDQQVELRYLFALRLWYKSKKKALETARSFGFVFAEFPIPDSEVISPVGLFLHSALDADAMAGRPKWVCSYHPLRMVGSFHIICFPPLGGFVYVIQPFSLKGTQPWSSIRLGNDFTPHMRCLAIAYHQ